MGDKQHDQDNLPVQHPLLDIVPAYNPQQHDPKQMDKFAILKHVLSQFEWSEEMARFMALGWSWKKAAFVAWSILPKSKRVPKTQYEFADLIDTNRGSVYKWQQDQVLQAEIMRIRAESLADNDQDVLNALVESAKNPSYRNKGDREIYLAMRGFYVPRRHVKVDNMETKADLSQLSEAELERQAGLQAIEGEVIDK